MFNFKKLLSTSSFVALALTISSPGWAQTSLEDLLKNAQKQNTTQSSPQSTPGTETIPTSESNTPKQLFNPASPIEPTHQTSSMPPVSLPQTNIPVDNKQNLPTPNLNQDSTKQNPSGLPTPFSNVPQNTNIPEPSPPSTAQNIFPPQPQNSLPTPIPTPTSEQSTLPAKIFEPPTNTVLPPSNPVSPQTPPQVFQNTEPKKLPKLEINPGTVENDIHLENEINRKRKELELKKLETDLKKEQKVQDEMDKKPEQTPSLPTQTSSFTPPLQQPVPQITQSQPQSHAEEEDLPGILYISGTGKKLTAKLIFSNGSILQVTENEELPNGYKIETIKDTSVKVSKGKSTKSLKFGTPTPKQTQSPGNFQSMNQRPQNQGMIGIPPQIQPGPMPF